MYLIFLGTLKISVCTIVYPLQKCIKYYRKKALSNGMPIYGQTVQYIWSKCAANKLWSSLVSVLECHTNAHMHDNTFGTKL